MNMFLFLVSENGFHGASHASQDYYN